MCIRDRDYLVDGGINPHHMMPGTGCCAITDSIKLTKHAVKLGVGGTLMLPPFYYKGVSDDGLYQSFSEIIQRVGSSDLRIYLYHIPPVSHIPLSLDLIERLIKQYPDTIVGIKDSSGDWNNTKRIHGNHPSLNLAFVLCCLLYTSPSPRDRQKSRMPSSA